MTDEIRNRLAAVCLRCGLEEVETNVSKAMSIAVFEQKKQQTSRVEVMFEDDGVWVYWDQWTNFSDEQEESEERKFFEWKDAGAAILLIESLAREYDLRALTAHNRGESKWQQNQ